MNHLVKPTDLDKVLEILANIIEKPTNIQHSIRDKFMSTIEKTLRVLVVDDNADQANSLSLLLKANGYDSHACVNALDCVALVERLRPEVVLLDLAMPGKSGYAIAQEIKDNSALRAIRLIAVTGHGLPLDRVHSNVSGFEHHLEKPVCFEDLEKVLQSVQDQE